MRSEGIFPAALAISQERDSSNSDATDEFPWPDFPCVTPTLAQRVRWVTATFPNEAETLAGLHCLPWVFQTGPAFLGKSETGQPNWIPQPEEGVMPGRLPVD